jgi:signal transduction histidine kinase
MDETAANHWVGKSAEDILAELVHHLRAPLHAAAGSLNVLKSVEGLSAEQTQQVIDLGLRSALRAQEVIDAISQYMAEKQEHQ